MNDCEPTALANSGPRERQEALDSALEEIDSLITQAEMDREAIIELEQRLLKAEQRAANASSNYLTLLQETAEEGVVIRHIKQWLAQNGAYSDECVYQNDAIQLGAPELICWLGDKIGWPEPVEDD